MTPPAWMSLLAEGATEGRPSTELASEPQLEPAAGRVQADIAILGSGPGGYVAAIHAAQSGARIALIESCELGGTCLNRGCIPSKALLRCAEIAMVMDSAKDYGFSVADAKIDLAAIIKRKDRVVKQLRSGVEFLMKKNNITVVAGRGCLTSPTKIAVAGPDGMSEVEANRIIIATGSVPSRPPIRGADHPSVITSDEMLDLETAPERLVVIGAGAVGLELAHAFRWFGSKVTVVEMLEEIIPLEDREIAGELRRALKKQKIDIFTSATVTEIAHDGPDGPLAVKFEHDQEDKAVAADVVLMAVGRSPAAQEIGLEEIGIEMEGRFIKVDDHLRTNLEGVYAIGDVIGGMLLAHKASAEGKVAVDNCLGGDRRMSYRAVPNALYTNPEVASVGLSEEAAAAAGHNISVGRFPYRASGKALAYGEREGLAKIVVDKRHGALLGVSIFGVHATDLIAEATLAIEHQMTAAELAETIHAHPTLSEVVMEAAEDSLGRAIHK